MARPMISNLARRCTAPARASAVTGTISIAPAMGDRLPLLDYESAIPSEMMAVK
jgi:hypothetical protein